MLVLSNFFLCHNVFKEPSAADASESVYMRERVKVTLVELGDEQPRSRSYYVKAQAVLDV